MSLYFLHLIYMLFNTCMKKELMFPLVSIGSCYLITFRSYSGMSGDLNEYMNVNKSFYTETLYFIQKHDQ